MSDDTPSPLNNVITIDDERINDRVVRDMARGEFSRYVQLRYVDLSPTFQRVVTYYVLLTWLYDAFNELPCLRLHGDYGSGNTRALLTIGSL